MTNRWAALGDGYETIVQLSASALAIAALVA